MQNSSCSDVAPGVVKKDPVLVNPIRQKGTSAEHKTSGTGRTERYYSGTATAKDQALYVNDLLTLAKVPGNEGKKAR